MELFPYLRRDSWARFTEAVFCNCSVDLQISRDSECRFMDQRCSSLCASQCFQLQVSGQNISLLFTLLLIAASRISGYGPRGYGYVHISSNYVEEMVWFFYPAEPQLCWFDNGSWTESIAPLFSVSLGSISGYCFVFKNTWISFSCTKKRLIKNVSLFF